MTRPHVPQQSRSVLNALGWMYIGSMLVWFGLRLVFFDGFWWLALLITLALYLFLPLVVLLPLALWSRRWSLLVGLIAPCAMFAALFSPLFLPAFKAPLANAEGPSLKILSFIILLMIDRIYAVICVGRFGGPGTLWVPLQESSFLVAVVGFAGNSYQKIESLWRQSLPNYSYVSL